MYNKKKLNGGSGELLRKKRKDVRGMKGKQYFSSAICCLSSVLGIAVLLLVFLLVGEFPVALACGLGTCLLVGILLPLYFWLGDRRYRDIEDDIPEEILMKEQISFSVPQSGRGGYLCVTPSALYLFSRDRKPHFAFRLPKDSMLSADVSQKYCLRLSVYDCGTGKATVISLLTPKSEELLSCLKRAGLIYSHRS